MRRAGKANLTPASAAGGEMLVQVREARGAEPAAARVALQRLEAQPFVADAARDLVERQPGALAARHHAPEMHRLGEVGATPHAGNMIMNNVFIIKARPAERLPI